jgi:hypothetical protein
LEHDAGDGRKDAASVVSWGRSDNFPSQQRDPGRHQNITMSIASSFQQSQRFINGSRKICVKISHDLGSFADSQEESLSNGFGLALVRLLFNEAHLRRTTVLEPTEYLEGAILRTVVHEDKMEGRISIDESFKLGSLETAFLVEAGNDERGARWTHFFFSAMAQVLSPGK